MFPQLASAAPKDEIVYALDEKVRAAVASKIPGASLAVIINGQIRLLRGYGVTKTGTKQQMSSATRFPLASISKTFASAATSLLVDKQLLDWDTHVVPYLEHVEFSDPQQGSAVTLRHLLSHTTGLVPQAYSDLLEDNVSYRRIRQMVKLIDFVCAPGNCYGYQNVIYNLSAEMIAQASGQDYPTFVREQLFIPLEMDHASFGLDGFTSHSNRVTPHVKVKKGCAAVKPQAAYYEVPAAAGVNASAQDLAKWMLAQFGHNPTVLKPSLLEIMHKPHIRANQRRYKAKLSNVYYGLGWRTFDYQGLTGFIHHGGWIKGIRTEMVFNTVTQTGMVFLINCEQNTVARNMVLEFLKLYKKYMVDEVQSSGS
ncbi:serine hydrolase [Photobacterium jeanii]|uniref:Serine hydrolase n=2 Tax=Photobacterium jeanii TaxID=858640 RepID=A0A178K304_9GAMM|nr:serine hydrolase [Photobacterium jeanii]PST91234.1 serine hydrolase [Photobacterium jeanii]